MQFPLNIHHSGGQFGIRIVGGKKVSGGVLCAFIASIAPGSPASKSLQLQEGAFPMVTVVTSMVIMIYQVSRKVRYVNFQEEQHIVILIQNFKIKLFRI